jgi:hypothetical protein
LSTDNGKRGVSLFIEAGKGRGMKRAEIEESEHTYTAGVFSSREEERPVFIFRRTEYDFPPLS